MMQQGDPAAWSSARHQHVPATRPQGARARHLACTSPVPTFPLARSHARTLTLARSSPSPTLRYNPIKTIKTNSIGTINMLGLAHRVGARMLMASASEVPPPPHSPTHLFPPSMSFICIRMRPQSVVMAVGPRSADALPGLPFLSRGLACRCTVTRRCTPRPRTTVATSTRSGRGLVVTKGSESLRPCAVRQTPLPPMPNAPPRPPLTPSPSPRLPVSPPAVGACSILPTPLQASTCAWALITHAEREEGGGEGGGG